MSPRRPIRHTLGHHAPSIGGAEAHPFGPDDITSEVPPRLLKRNRYAPGEANQILRFRGILAVCHPRHTLVLSAAICAEARFAVPAKMPTRTNARQKFGRRRAQHCVAGSTAMTVRALVLRSRKRSRRGGHLNVGRPNGRLYLHAIPMLGTTVCPANEPAAWFKLLGTVPVVGLRQDALTFITEIGTSTTTNQRTL